MWNKTTNKLPESFISVLMYIPSQEPFPLVREGYLFTDDYDDNSNLNSRKWYCPALNEKFTLEDVTYWMDMPKPPKEKV